MKEYDIEAASKLLPTAALPGLTCGDTRQLARRLAVTGMINCRPLWQTSESCIAALRYDVGNPGPVIAVCDILANESVQIASRPAFAVPLLFLRSLMNCHSSEWNTLRDNVSGELEPLLSMDATLGGSLTIEAINNLLENTDLQNTFCFDRDGSDLENNVAAAVELVAPEEPRCQFQKTIARVLDELWIEDLLDSDFGEWRIPSCAVLSAISFAEELQDRTSVWLRCVNAPVNQDEEWSNGIGLSVNRKMAGDEYGAQLLAVGHLVKNNAVAEAGYFAPVVESMSEQGASYDGTAHLNIISNLVESEQFELAWNASLSAGYWMAKSRRSVPNEMMQLQGKIAKDHFPDQLWPAVRENLLAMGFSVETLDV